MWSRLYYNEKSYKNRQRQLSKIQLKMVFCYHNCSDLLREKIVLFSDREKLLKFETEGREFAKSLGSLEQSIRTVKDQNNVC